MCMVITETWLKDGRSLDNNAADLELGAGIALIHRGRREKRRGGVGILFQSSTLALKKVSLQGNTHEIVAASPGQTRRVKRH